MAPLTLVCGLLGHGKTLYAVSRIADEAKAEGLQVYYAGIPACTVPGWKELPGANDLDEKTLAYSPSAIAAARRWYQLPAKSVVVIDEAHQIFPQRGPSAAVPEWVGMIAVLRRLGLSVVLITQNGSTLDHFVRQKAGRYLVVWRPMGLARATVWEFPQWLDWQDYHQRQQGSKSLWAYPKDAFGLYKSAEVHLVKRRIPLKALWFPLGLVGICFALFMAYRSLMGGAADSTKAIAKQTNAVQAAAGAPAPAVHGQTGAVVMTAAEFIQKRVPRFADFPESAPLYDSLASPVTFPVLAACVQSAARCVCYSQQGSKLPGVSPEMCAGFVRDGSFNPYAVQTSQDKRGYGGPPAPHGEHKNSTQAMVGGLSGSSESAQLLPAEPPVTFPERAVGQGRAAPRPRP